MLEELGQSIIEFAHDKFSTIDLLDITVSKVGNDFLIVPIFREPLENIKSEASIDAFSKIFE